MLRGYHSTILALSLIAVLGLTACDNDSTRMQAEATTTSTLSPPGAATTTTTLVPPSTTLPPTTTSTTTTTTPTSTVCSGSSTFACTILVRVVSSEQLGSLQFELDYSATALQPEGSADRVTCTGVPGAINTFNDDEAASTLRVGMISLTSFSGPITVTECAAHFGFGCTPIGDPGTRDDLVLTLVDAASPTFDPLTPTLELETLGCFPGDAPAFPTTTTSTTLP